MDATVTLVVKLARVVHHLAEFTDTGHPWYLQAALGVLDDPDVSLPLQELHELGLLPVARSGRDIRTMVANDVEGGCCNGA